MAATESSISKKGAPFGWRAVSRKTERSNLPEYAALIALLVFMLWPFVYVVSASLMPYREIMEGARLLPENPTLDNYATLFRITPIRNFPRVVMNSLMVGIATGIITTVIASLAAYGFTRDRRLVAGIVPRALLFIYVFPTIIIVVPIYQMFVQVGLFDSLWSLVVVAVAMSAPFCTWLLISFFGTIPKELEESAQIDGAGSLTVFFRIVLPLAAPGLLTAGMFAFIEAWGEYLFSLILIQRSALNTAPLGLATYTGEQYIEWGPLMAGAMAVTVPVIVVFIPLARLFIRGFTAGAMKA